MQNARCALIVFLFVVVLGYSIPRFLETALPYAGNLPHPVEACRPAFCSVALLLHDLVGYASLPVGLVLAVLLVRSHSAAFPFCAAFLFLASLADISAMAALWRYYGFAESFSSPHRDALLIVRLIAPPLGVGAALVLQGRNSPWRAA